MVALPRQQGKVPSFLSVNERLVQKGTPHVYQHSHTLSLILSVANPLSGMFKEQDGNPHKH